MNALFALVNNVSMKSEKVEALWAHLHWLTVLAQQGSYTAAAQRLGVSKAAMSQHIAELERAAGVPLVQRTTRSVRLTEAGQRLVDGMREPFERIAQSFSSVRDMAELPSGRIRVTAPVAPRRRAFWASDGRPVGLWVGLVPVVTHSWTSLVHSRGTHGS